MCCYKCQLYSVLCGKCTLFLHHKLANSGGTEVKVSQRCSAGAVTKMWDILTLPYPRLPSCASFPSPQRSEHRIAEIIV